MHGPLNPPQTAPIISPKRSHTTSFRLPHDRATSRTYMVLRQHMAFTARTHFRKHHIHTLIGVQSICIRIRRMIKSTFLHSTSRPVYSAHRSTHTILTLLQILHSLNSPSDPLGLHKNKSILFHPAICRSHAPSQFRNGA